MKHTPGPWEASESYDFADTFVAYISSNDLQIAQTRASTKEASEANAKLIAASPALLEACKASIELIPLIQQGIGTGHPDYSQRKEKIEAAIAKAEGR